MTNALTKIRVPGLEPTYAGKVRDLYDLGDTLLLVATDRISAFDCVFPTGIPGKGKLLTQISKFWFEKTKDLFPNHVISTDVNDFPEPFKSHPELFAGRSMLCKKAKRIDFECVVRGYLTGSFWKEYKSNSKIEGYPQIPAGMVESEKFPVPLFTPATKADTGHDENISVERMASEAGAELTRKLEKLSIELYNFGNDYAVSKGLILADTKFEFGQLADGSIILIDEILTPDSSRFWPGDEYEAGRPQFQFDKQYVRDYCNTLDWDKNPPAPELPDNVVAKTAERYQEAYRRLTGRAFEGE